MPEKGMKRKNCATEVTRLGIKYVINYLDYLLEVYDSRT